MVRGETDEERNNLKTSKRKAKQRRIIEEPKLDNARRLRGIYSIDPDDEEVKKNHEKRS